MVAKAAQRKREAKEAEGADSDSDDEKALFPRPMRRSRSWDAASILSFESTGGKRSVRSADKQLGRKLGTGWPFHSQKRRTVLIATQECVACSQLALRDGGGR